MSNVTIHEGVNGQEVSIKKVSSGVIVRRGGRTLKAQLNYDKVRLDELKKKKDEANISIAESNHRDCARLFGSILSKKRRG